MTVDIRCGDVIEVLREYDDETFTAVLTDPPYGLKFMGKDWDHGIPGRRYWAEVLRVCKPGAVLLAFGGSRTHHRLMVAIEDAGFEIYDVIMWVYGSGFPKSHAIGKAIDKEAGAERRLGPRTQYANGTYGRDTAHAFVGKPSNDVARVHQTIPATDDAATWDGYGTALKPAFEPIVLARRPRTDTYATHAVRDGTAALNIDESRVPTEDSLSGGGCDGHVSEPQEGWDRPWKHDADRVAKHAAKRKANVAHAERLGRWPANLILDDHAAAALDEMSGDCGGRWGKHSGQPVIGSTVFPERSSGNVKERCERFTGDTKGGASRFFARANYTEADRFFYTPKSSRGERDAGLEGRPLTFAPKGNYEGRDMDNPKNHLGGLQSAKMRNTNPCVKPLELCVYLSKLVRVPEPYLDDATLLVPFAGSGSEIIGAVLAGWRNVVGIDNNAEYCDIARARVAWWREAYERFRIDDPKALREAMEGFEELPLFQEASS